MKTKKITESQLRSIIKESLSTILSEKKWNGNMSDDEGDENYYNTKHDNNYTNFEKIKRNKPLKTVRDYLEEDSTEGYDGRICQVISALKEQYDILSDMCNAQDYHGGSFLSRVCDLIEDAIKRLEDNTNC